MAEQLTPSQTAGLDTRKVLGFATVGGGTTSHVAILARAFGLPAICGMPGQMLALANGAQVLLDADLWQVEADAQQLDRQELLARVTHRRRAPTQGEDRHQIEQDKGRHPRQRPGQQGELVPRQQGQDRRLDSLGLVDGLLELRRLGDAQPHPKADKDQQRTGDEGNTPAPAQKLLIRQRRRQHDEAQGRQDEADRRAQLREHAEPRPFALGRILRGQQHGAQTQWHGTILTSKVISARLCLPSVNDTSTLETSHSPASGLRSVLAAALALVLGLSGCASLDAWQRQKIYRPSVLQGVAETEARGRMRV